MFSRFVANKKVAVTGVVLLVSGLFSANVNSAIAAPNYDLCDISTNFDSLEEWITEIQVDSSQISPVNDDQNSYYNSDNAGDTPIALISGETATLSVTVQADVGSVGSDWDEALAVWIDFNGDNTLDDNTELIFDDFSNTADWTDLGGGIFESTYSTSFTVPSNAAAGEQWARTFNFEDGILTTPLDACLTNDGTGIYGSAADFVVDISAPTPSPTPSPTNSSSTLPNTGSNAENIFNFSSLLLVGGTALIAIAAIRRRRS